MTTVTFTCRVCEMEFQADWSFGGVVECVHCHRQYETEYEINYTDEGEDVVGPWLTRMVKP